MSSGGRDAEGAPSPGPVPDAVGTGLPERGVSAHRGGAAGAPENTLAAFRRAAAQGAHQIELDTRVSADGAIVVIHDDRVNRTTDGRGRVRDLTLDELRRLDAGVCWGGRHRNERIPTLAEALAVMPRDVWINLQIKRGEPIAEEVARQVVESGRTRQVVLACGNDAGERARRVHPDLLLCNLVRKRSRASYLEHAIAMGSSFIQFHHARGPMEPALVERAHAAGLRVNYCCAPDVGTAPLLALFACGVDFLLVDDVPRALDAARRAGIDPVVRTAAAARDA